MTLLIPWVEIILSFLCGLLIPIKSVGWFFRFLFEMISNRILDWVGVLGLWLSNLHAIHISNLVDKNIYFPSIDHHHSNNKFEMQRTRETYKTRDQCLQKGKNG